MQGLLRGWAVQKRVLGALFMREIQTRWGRRNLGFAWLFAEPLMFAFPVLGMWSIMRGQVERDVRVIPLMWTGYMGILMFRHVSGHAIYVVRRNSAMLYHTAVTPLDIVVGLCGLELIGSLGATAFSFFILYFFGCLDWPVNVPLYLVGNFYMAWWSFAVALIVAGGSERTDLVVHIWAPVSYMYLPVSGFFYLAEWLPTSFRHLALTLLPSLHAYEMIRGGLFGNRIETYYDPAYLSAILAVLTLVGLWLVRSVREHLELE